MAFDLYSPISLPILGLNAATRQSSSNATNRIRAQQVDTLFKNVAPGVLGAGAANIVLETILVHLDSIDHVKGVVWFLFMMFCIAAHLSLLSFYRSAPFDENKWK